MGLCDMFIRFSIQQDQDHTSDESDINIMTKFLRNHRHEKAQETPRSTGQVTESGGTIIRPNSETRCHRQRGTHLRPLSPATGTVQTSSPLARPHHSSSIDKRRHRSLYHIKVNYTVDEIELFQVTYHAARLAP